MTCLGVAEQSGLGGGVIGNEAGKTLSRPSTDLLLRVWTLKDWGQSRILRAGKGHDCANFRNMILAEVWRVKRKGRDWMSGSRSECAPPWVG